MIQDLTAEDVNGDAAPQRGEHHPRRIFNIALILLIISFVLFLCQLVNLGTGRAKASGVDSLPVSIRAASQADYSVDAHGPIIAPIREDILRQIIWDIPATGAAQARIGTLQAVLLSPVPTMTADYRLPLTATPRLASTQVNTSTPPASIVLTFVPPTRFVPFTPTVAYTYPTYGPVVPTSTKTPRPPTKTPAPSPAFTQAPTVTVTETSTRTLTPAPTTTATPTHTLAFTATETATSTLTYTATSTATPTATETATNTATATNTPTPTPTPTPTLTASQTPTSTWTPSPTATLSSGCVAYPTGGFAAVQDTWVDNTNPDLSYASDPALKIRPSAGVDQRALVAFDLSSIPPGSTVLSAALYLTVTTGDNYAVEFYPVTQSWVETVTWNTKPAYDVTSAGSFTLSTSVCTRVSSFSTLLVSAWINDPFSNYGIYLFPPAGAGQAAFSSREGTNPPVLVINYIPP